MTILKNKMVGMLLGATLMCTAAVSVTLLLTIIAAGAEKGFGW